MPTFARDALNELVESTDEPLLAARILSALQGANFGPLRMEDESTYSVQMRDAHLLLSHEHRARFRGAVARAVREWETVDDPRVLESLVLLSSYVHAEDAIPYLRRLLEAYVVRAERGFAEYDDVFDVVESTLSALHAFAPNPAVRQLFHSLYFGDVLVPAFCGQLFVALCRCEPEQYTAYVPRLLHFVRVAPDAFPRLDLLLGQFMDTVTPDVYFHELPKLGQHFQVELLELVQQPEFGILIAVPAQDHLEVFRVLGEPPAAMDLPPATVATVVDAGVAAIEKSEDGAVGFVDRLFDAYDKELELAGV